MSEFAKREEEILKFWDTNHIFQKTIDQRPANKPYIFYDGPPFATGLPHYGHIVASVMKDMVPRFWTMRGFRVPRRWGWDCHGLPVENIVEGQLNLGSKKEIERFGVDRFNESCRSCVLQYTNEWKKTISRIGRFVDMEHDYKTMNPEYMESVWWVWKSLWDKKLIYQDYKSMHICPRCETPLSNFEVTQGYKDVEDISVTAKFKLTNAKEKFGLDGDVSILAWTTTPWTLPGNVLLAVGEKINYVAVKMADETLVMAKDRVQDVLKDAKFEIIKEVAGKNLVGLTYEPIFPYFKNTKNAFRVVTADFVTTTDGTGVVHIAPAFGEDDYKVGKSEQVPLVQHVDTTGRFTKEVTDFAGKEVKAKDAPQATDIEILKWLAGKNVLFAKQKIKHSYPHCWRCDTPLLNYLTSSWFIRVTELKDKMLKNNKKISWVPEHIKTGRFGKWLADARDWAVSRNRFWGTPLPVWQSADGKDFICVGSIKELEELSGQSVIDLHKHLVDKITFKKNGKTYSRVPEVLDCWFESGSMPYAERHYPFENKNKLSKEFPAQFIAEGQDQTRGWFYTLVVLATALWNKPPFLNVVVNGIVLAEDGQKMSKRLKNYPDPNEVINKYGADALRYYLMSSPVVKSENLNFSEKGVKEVVGKVLMITWNVFKFYEMHADKNITGVKKTSHQNFADAKLKRASLDQWIISKLNSLVSDVTAAYEKYDLADATRPIGEFVGELSTWYVRRSRDRFKGAEKAVALGTLHEVLVTLSKVMAPVMPFMAEELYQELKKNDASLTDESVHLAMWPAYNTKLINEKVLTEMTAVRKTVELALALRAAAGIKVRQPLAELVVSGTKLSADSIDILSLEINVNRVVATDNIPAGTHWVSKKENDITVALNTQLTDELKRDGLKRELIHSLNMVRKNQKLTINDHVALTLSTTNNELAEIIKNHEQEIKESVLATKLTFAKTISSPTATITIDNSSVLVLIT